MGSALLSLHNQEQHSDPSCATFLGAHADDCVSISMLPAVGACPSLEESMPQLADVSSGLWPPKQVGEQQVTEVSSATPATYSGAHRCPSVVNRLERSASPIRWTLWASVSGSRQSSSVSSSMATPSARRLLGDKSPMILAGTSSMSSAHSHGVDSTLATDILDDHGARHIRIGAARSVSNGWVGRLISKRVRGMGIGDGPAAVDW